MEQDLVGKVVRIQVWKSPGLDIQEFLHCVFSPDAISLMIGNAELLIQFLHHLESFL